MTAQCHIAPVPDRSRHAVGASALASWDQGSQRGRHAIARHTDTPDPRWPPAFSPAYLESARQLLDRRQVLLIVGAPGSNRHRLGRSIVDLPDHEGVVWHHICLHDDGDQPLRTLTRLLVTVGADVSTPSDRAADALLDVVRRQGDVPPTLLLDGAAFADPASLDALADLAAERALRLVLALSPESVLNVPRLATMAERIDLAPLDRETIARLLRDRLGAEPHHVLVAFALERSQGAYGSLCDLGDLLEDAGALVRAEGVVMIDTDRLETARLSLPVRRRPLSAERLGGGTEMVALIDLVAMIGEVEIAEAEVCVDPALIAFAVRHGALRQDDGVLSMVDSLEAEAVVAAMTPARMAELWQMYAGRLGDSIVRPESVIRTVRWCMVSGAAVSPELSRTAAREANNRGLYRRTVTFTAPGVTTADPMVTQQDRAHALTQIGDLAGLADLLDSLDPAEVPEDQLMHFMRWSTRVVPPDRLALLREAAVGPGRDPVTQRRRAVVVELARLYASAFDEVTPEMVRTVRGWTLSGELSPTNVAIAHSAMAALLRHAGRPAEAVHSGRAAVALMESPEVDAGSAVLDPTREILVMALLSAQDLEGAQEVLESYEAQGIRYGVGGRLGLPLAGLIVLMRGRPEVALAYVRLFLARTVESDAMGYRGWVEAIAAQLLAMLERHDEARAMLAASEEQATHQRRQNDLERRHAQAIAHDLLADPERALEILDAVAHEAEQHGLRHAQLDALGIAMLVDGPRLGQALLTAIGDAPQLSGTPALWQAFARAVVAYDFDALVALTDRLAAEGRELFAARVAQFTLDAGRRASDIDPAARERLDRLTRHE